MKVLITGGAGYIGSVVSAKLLSEGHEVVIADDLSRGHRDAVPEGAEFVQANLLDQNEAARIASGGFEAVMHFAAKIEVGESAKEPGLYFRHNLTTALNVVEAVRSAGVRRLIVSSTAAVYGEPKQVPIEETAATVPTNAYGASKLAVDQLLGFATAAHGFSAVSLRYFNVAGAFGRFGERHNPETHLIPNLLKAARDGKEFYLFGNDYDTPDGTCMRDYLHVEDLAQAHLLALGDKAADPGKHKVYNLGTGEGFTVKQMVEAAERVTGKQIKVAMQPRRGGDSARLVASSRRIHEELGWRPQKSDIETMIGDAWAFMQVTGAKV